MHTLGGVPGCARQPGTPLRAQALPFSDSLERHAWTIKPSRDLSTIISTVLFQLTPGGKAKADICIPLFIPVVSVLKQWYPIY